MSKVKEYINISDFLYMNIKGINEDEIKTKDFSYEKYSCALEIGDSRLDFGIKSHKRISIKECEEKNYLNKELEYNDIIVIMDNLLLQLVKLLNGNHPFLTVLSCYYLHNSNVINCNEKYFFEKVFLRWLTSFSYDSMYIDIFINDNKEFIKYMKDNNLNENANSQKEFIFFNKNECNLIYEESYIKKKIFFFFELFLIFYSCSLEIVDYIITKNYMIHRDDYKYGILNLTDSLIYHCRKNRKYVLKNMFIIKRCFVKFLTKFEEKKNKNKLIYSIFNRIKFIIYFTSILNYITFEFCDISSDTIKEKCTQLLNCVNSINKELNCNIIKYDKKTIKKYFNKYLLMHKLDHVSKHITKMSIDESYNFYKNIINDIKYVGEYFKLINVRSSFFDIKNILHYIKYYSYSNSILTKCISLICLKQLISKEKKIFYDFEKELILKQEIDAECFINNVRNTAENIKIIYSKLVNRIHKSNKEYYKKIDNKINDDSSKNDNNIEKNNQIDSYTKEVYYYYSFFLNIYRKKEKCSSYYGILNDELFNSIEENFFVNFFLFLFLNESYIIMDEIVKNKTNLYVKNIIFNDLNYFGFSTHLLVLFMNFVHFPDTFFIIIEHILKIDKGLNYEKIYENKNFFKKKKFSTTVINKLRCKLRVNFPHLIKCIQKESSIIEIYEELEKFINEYIFELDEDIISKSENNIKEDNSEKDKDNNNINNDNNDNINKYDNNNDNNDNINKYDNNNDDNNTNNDDNNINNDDNINKDDNNDDNNNNINNNDNDNDDDNIFKHDNEYNNFINVTKKRMKFLILCKIFNLFFQYLEIVIKKIINFSFLLSSREHSKLNKFYTEMRTLYILMKILTYNLKLYNLNNEAESIQNYYKCILHTVLIDYNCLSLYISLPSDQEYSFTYYVMSVCYKELSTTLLKNVKLNYTQEFSIYIYSMFYYILYLYSEFLMVYFIHVAYTNINSQQLEKYSFELKYVLWDFCYPDIIKIDFNNYQMNKSLLINFLISKNLKINYSHNKFNIGTKKKLKNLNEVKEKYLNTKNLVNMYSNLIKINNSIKYKFRIFEKSYSDFDINAYFKECINEIAKYIKDLTKSKYDKLYFINIFLKSCEYNLYKSYKKIPPLCIENNSIFLNPNYKVVKNHSFFLSVEKKITI
ncbi:conserved Plasmodium protein, unknown function [Plasmodium gallinaceum]|uniref:NAA35-like N-terminal domain-containing protein n=1 Tax=Plasmodium gallinaceum TaxID=5849 RepID=A0A1J1GW20_PLAGA|nr:conserved Plasmodium protein, unknown function [Plasmodium gallinaceum]CRG96662.1 conserved Plasmodium protein, unknown function [Plasmodium gallinaceum]